MPTELSQPTSSQRLPWAISTTQWLLDAAEVLLVERGSTAMSVRDVFAQAGVANASAVG